MKLGSVNILLGVSGGISAYKVVDLASSLRGGGANVQTVMTENACKLIGPKSFEAVTGGAVFTSLWDSSEEYRIGHVKLADWADIVVVAPATANIIGKVANGICDEILSTTICANWGKAMLFVPAMNDRMWGSPAVERNVEVLKERGIVFVGPVEGRLACGSEGAGRMSEVAEIIGTIEKAASHIKDSK